MQRAPKCGKGQHKEKNNCGHKHMCKEQWIKLSLFEKKINIENTKWSHVSDTSEKVSVWTRCNV